MLHGALDVLLLVTCRGDDVQSWPLRSLRARDLGQLCQGKEPDERPDEGVDTEDRGDGDYEQIGDRHGGLSRW
jgi:hypothetical protein